MKKIITYIFTILLFTAQNVFAQSETDAELMDMGVYATRMGSVFLLMLFTMFAFFLYSAAKEPIDSEESEIKTAVTCIKSFVNTTSGNSIFLLPVIGKDLQRINFFLISALITFSIILILLII